MATIRTNRSLKYNTFTKAELELFGNLLDVEKSGVINLADLEATCKQLGLD
jgi:hypothetical protein